ncbi:MAG: TraR/DksA C4-type zinc finger protein [Flammeovirgaceae bacterium]|nr:TraR/DksA C4-type zinc finger protein [Flammeovirgaceae bacterium]
MEKKEIIRYSTEELKEFEVLLKNKLQEEKKRLEELKKAIVRGFSGYDTNHEGFKNVEDGQDSFEREHLNQLAARTQKYIIQLESALIRIKNGTYGVCVETGKLIPKERLRAVPHTQYSIEAKMSKS